MDEATRATLSVLLLVAIAGLYLLPGIIASFIRHHPNADAIGVINIFLGWTFLGWVVALAWSLTGPNMANTAPCPYCAEPIKRAAKVCRFCGRQVAAAT